PRILAPSVAAFALIVAEAIVGAIVVRGDLKAVLVTAHLATATFLVGVLVYLTTILFILDRPPRPTAPAAHNAVVRLATVSAASLFALLLVGAYVRGRGAGLAFPDWPLMNGKLVPQLGGVATAMFAHRVLAAVVGLLVVYLAIRAWTMQPRTRAVLVLATIAFGLFVAQVMVGAALVWTKLDAAPKVAHVLLAELVWGALVALVTVSRSHAGSTETGTAADIQEERPPASIRERTVAYFQLTKPRIIVLLLITTIPAMVLAKNGWPSTLLVASTL